MTSENSYLVFFSKINGKNRKLTANYRDHAPKCFAQSVRRVRCYFPPTSLLSETSCFLQKQSALFPQTERIEQEHRSSSGRLHHCADAPLRPLATLNSRPPASSLNSRNSAVNLCRSDRPEHVCIPLLFFNLTAHKVKEPCVLQALAGGSSPPVHTLPSPGLFVSALCYCCFN